MNIRNKSIVVLVFFSLLTLSFPMEMFCEFYKYVDKHGQVLFVDDVSKVPEEYRDQLTTYKEKYDHLSPEKRAVMLEKDRQQREIERAEQAARREQLRNLETKVTIEGNLVIVPVALAYKGNEAEAFLVLDTGASIITLHRPIADRLNIMEEAKASTRVVGGNVITSSIAKLSHVKLGPFTKKNLHAAIIEHQGPEVSYDGFLGMNFLKDLEYSINFQKKVIRWKP